MKLLLRGPRRMSLLTKKNKDTWKYVQTLVSCVLNREIIKTFLAAVKGILKVLFSYDVCYFG